MLRFAVSVHSLILGDVPTIYHLRSLSRLCLRKGGLRRKPFCAKHKNHQCPAILFIRLRLLAKSAQSRLLHILSRYPSAKSRLDDNDDREDQERHQGGEEIKPLLLEHESHFSLADSPNRNSQGNWGSEHQGHDHQKHLDHSERHG